MSYPEYHPQFRKLWIDDVRDPNEYAKDPANWLWVKTYDEAENALLAHSWDVVSFDHDLSEEHYSLLPEKANRTGYHLAVICERGAYFKTMKQFDWKVHSQNPQGAARIRMSLNKADEFWNEN